MSNLFATLRSSTTALQAITQAVAITQNNVTNAGSAGYAKQRVNMQALAFDPDRGIAGGVENGKLQSTRDQYIERSVRTQAGRAAAADTDTIALTKLEQVMQLSSGDSIPSALNRLYSAFSAWAVAPDDLAVKSDVITAGAGVAASFRKTADKLAEVTTDNGNEIKTVVDRINRLAGRIKEYNEQIRTGSMEDAGVDAGIHNTLEELSQDVNVEATLQPDGTYTLLLAGEHPLVIGTQQYEISADFSAPPSAAIVTSKGDDITASVKDSRLSALLEFRHTTLAEIQGDSTQAGELNRLAQKILDRLNAAWPPPAQPFLVAGASAVSVAHTLSVNPAIAPAMLDAVEPGPPPVANGKALQLAALANPTQNGDKIDGLSFTEFYGQIASKVGSKLNDAKFTAESQTQLSAQVKAFRDQISGVSIDEEALNLMQFQRAYQASARIVAAIDQLLEVAVNLGK